jgi:hypothetical protein
LLTSDLALLAMGIDLLLLGASIAVLDAHDEGEALLPDAARSLMLTGAVAAVFGGQVAVVMAIVAADNRDALPALPVLNALLFGVLAAAVIVPALAPQVQTWIDRLLLPPPQQTERAELQAVYQALPRQTAPVQPLALDSDAFTRLTRRALSHLSDLERLAVSPLIYLPLIDARLRQGHLPDSTLNRAMVLKALLTDCVLRLKPDSDAAFGTGDAWRYYNALYYPYVAGLKPYRLYPDDAGLDAGARAALAWFQREVPERTLHNWQNKAAQLIARDLQEQAAQMAS